MESQGEKSDDEPEGYSEPLKTNENTIDLLNGTWAPNSMSSSGQVTYIFTAAPTIKFNESNQLLQDNQQQEIQIQFQSSNVNSVNPQEPFQMIWGNPVETLQIQPFSDPTSQLLQIEPNELFHQYNNESETTDIEPDQNYEISNQINEKSKKSRKDKNNEIPDNEIFFPANMISPSKRRKTLKVLRPVQRKGKGAKKVITGEKIVERNKIDKISIDRDPDEFESSFEEQNNSNKPKSSIPKKKRKLADWIKEGIDPTVLEENLDQVKLRFEKGCECQGQGDGESCFAGINPEFVYKHRLNIADLTRAEHDMYLMGVTMSLLNNPEATARNAKRQRLRSSYVFLGREVCLDAWLYIENCTHYQLKRIRKHLMTHGVTTRVHGNSGKKPHNTFPFRSYQLAFDFLKSWFTDNGGIRNEFINPYGEVPIKSRQRNRKKTMPMPIYLQPEFTRKKLHQEYKKYFEDIARRNPQGDALDSKVMGYSSFRQFLKVRFPHVKFAKVDLINTKQLNSQEKRAKNLAQGRSAANLIPIQTTNTIGNGIGDPSAQLVFSILPKTDGSNLIYIDQT